jgi:hypothetical protein
MKVRCVRGPVFVDGRMMFSGDVRDIRHPTVAERLVTEHPDQLVFVEVEALADVSGDVAMSEDHQDQVVNEAAAAEALLEERSIKALETEAAIDKFRAGGKRGRR